MSTKSAYFRPDVLLMSLAINILGLALPLALLQIYDRILPSESFGTATLLVTGVGIAILLDACLRYGRASIFINMGARYEALTIVSMFERILKADINELETRGHASISDAFRAVPQVRDLSSGQAAIGLYDIPFVFIYFGMIAYVGNWLVVIPLSLFVVAIFVTLIITIFISKHVNRVEEKLAQRRDFEWALVSGVPYFKSMGAESGILRYFSDINDRLLKQHISLDSYTNLIKENSMLFSQLSTILIVVFGAIQVISGNLTTGALAACTLLAGRSIGPMMSSLGYLTRVAQLTVAKEKVNALLAIPSSKALNHNSDAGDKIESIKFELEGKIFKQGKVSIEQGELVYLDAPDSVLPSRILSQIAGMSQPRLLSIKVNDQILSNIPAQSYRRSVTLVPRVSSLLPGSILNNLTLYNPRYNDKAAALITDLGLDSYLNNLRNGVLTEIGPTTAEILDEGICQRIALIRALVHEPVVLLLDYAAVEIDMDGQKRLLNVLKSLKGHVTVIMATNNSMFKEIADKMIVLSADQA